MADELRLWYFYSLYKSYFRRVICYVLCSEHVRLYVALGLYTFYVL